MVESQVCALLKCLNATLYRYYIIMNALLKVVLIGDAGAGKSAHRNAGPVLMPTAISSFVLRHA
jgi:hypothetical protein